MIKHRVRRLPLTMQKVYACIRAIGQQHGLKMICVDVIHLINCFW